MFTNNTSNLTIRFFFINWHIFE